MTYTLGYKCAKNVCKQTVLVHLIIENMVTCFSETHSLLDDATNVWLFVINCDRHVPEDCVVCCRVSQVVDYYTGRGSHMFVCFADFRKAFDRVNYWKLFKQLIDIGLSTQIVSLLAYWYSHQHVYVRWRNALSSSFTVGNGTKQGGILSPGLFNCYLRDLVIAILSTKVGCNIGGLFVNILAYADDVVLLAPSIHGLFTAVD